MGDRVIARDRVIECAQKTEKIEEPYMPKSKENREGFTEEEDRLWRETVKTGEDMRRMFNMRDERRRREGRPSRRRPLMSDPRD